MPGLQPYVKRNLSEKISRENAITILDYIFALRTEANTSTFYKEAVINTLTTLSKFHPDMAFRDMTREDIITFLNRLRKSDDQDRKHRWVGTYNQNIINLNRFYKWLYYPLLEPAERPKSDQLQNVRKLKRREQSNYEDTDLWLDADCNRVFLKHCPSVRDRAFHAMMLDTSCRPKELMNARIKDIQFIEEGYNQRHAIIRVTGKSGQLIKKMLYKSLPYVKDWLSPGNHPFPDNLDAYILCGEGKKNFGRRLERHHYSHRYNEYKIYFQKLLNSSDVSTEDKKIIGEKMLSKPWRPYVLRYTSLTEKANGSLNEYQLREHADWTVSSLMPRRYLKFRGDESIRALQQVHGIVSIKEEHNSELGTLAPTIICYNCKEPNKAGSRICSTCKMILSFEAQVEMQQQQQATETQLQEMQKQISDLFEVLQGANVMKQIDEEQKRMLIESPKYRHAAKRALQEEQEELIREMQEGEEGEY